MVKLYVISGGPGTGKTCVVEYLRNQGYKILSETAREVAESDKRFIGKSINEIYEIDKKGFQDAIFNLQIKQLKKILKLKKEKIVFLDRSMIDTSVYYELNNLKIPEELLKDIYKIRYSRIFILDLIPYKKDSLRNESEEERVEIHNKIIKAYRKYGYKPIIVPPMNISKRSIFILKSLI